MYRLQEDMEITHGNGITTQNSSPMLSDYGAGYIEHPVSKFDTLAGVAIKYGVEVADIKKMNALVSDLQMFALKSLHIPTPGRHPPSPCSFDDLEISRHKFSNLLDSFQSLRVASSQHLECVDSSNATANGKGESDDDSKPRLSHHRKSKSLLGDSLDENGEFSDITAALNDGGAAKGNEKLVRRRQKSVADFQTATGKDEFYSEPRKSLDLRVKTAGKSNLVNGAEMAVDSAEESGMGNGGITRRSSSTANLEEHEKGNSSSIWPTYSWNDLQALSSAVVTKSLFDGMPKPPTRFKASMD